MSSHIFWSKASPTFEVYVHFFPNGDVLDSIVPYYADGKTKVPESRHILNLNGDLTDRLQSDVCIVDRGFRDVIDSFKETKMPSFLQQGTVRKQISLRYTGLLRRILAE